MAQIIKKKNHLKNQYNSYRLKTAGSLLGMLFVFPALSFIIPILAIPGVILCVILTGYFAKQTRVLRSGVVGEKNTVELLSQLPDNCHIFNDIKIEVDGQSSEMDNIIVSPYGVCIVETKNHKGRIIGNIEEKNWTQHKVGRGGTPYKKTFYNPVKQVKTHTWRLSQYLKANKVNIWVKSSVYFSNRNTSVDVRNSGDGSIPVFSYGDSQELMNYILTSEKKLLNEKEIQQVVQLLKQVS
ncbi:hypothetical protein CVD28_00325 [Bacillus sp. M6-12]|uniref:nuclease-related domain-containing protein n=1 Tax=Bacillus sp. M6-12 TaxID=2054166 RepID=UPI000C76D2B2|nr:nuclease-related domain-containing protein [Bacillus sp. M6-12]PLS18881.1 hypothetical protein CVD28_00325 [Bacillus sp. M6-12]